MTSMRSAVKMMYYLAEVVTNPEKVVMKLLDDYEADKDSEDFKQFQEMMTTKIGCSTAKFLVEDTTVSVKLFDTDETGENLMKFALGNFNKIRGILSQEDALKAQTVLSSLEFVQYPKERILEIRYGPVTNEKILERIKEVL